MRSTFRIQQADCHPSHRTMAKPRTRQLCFDPALLEGDDFDVQHFVASVRSKVPLSVLRDDLRANLEQLQAELVTCVQHDFQTFVSLGPSIAEVEPLARTALTPLGSLRTDLATLVSSLDDEIKELGSTLDARARTSARKAALETILRAHELLQKTERLVKAHARMPASEEDALRLSERIATASAQLEFALARAGDGAFVRSLAVRVGVVRRSVRSVFEGWLRRSLQPSGARDGYDTATLSRALGMHATAGLCADAEAFFRREVVAPFANARLKLAPMLAAAERRAGRSGGVSAADALECATEEVLAFLGEKVTPIVSLVESEERLRSRLDFVTEAVWPAVEAAVCGNMAAAFSPGIPDVFHKSVRAGARLYSAVEAATGNDSQRARLRESKSSREFWKRWNLPVYFQLRFSDITSSFDECLRAGPKPVSSSPENAQGATAGLLRSDVYKVRATVALVAALRRCWAEDVFLPALTHRFVRLSLQLLARYVTWVRSGLAGDWKDSDAVSAGAALVYADVVLLQKRVPAELAAIQRKRTSGLPDGMLEELDCAFSDAVGECSGLLPDLSASISDALASKCVENLKPLRSILATYHMSSKPAPTTHSQFVPKILKGLNVFLTANEKRLPEDERAKIAAAVAEQTTMEYCKMATELLSKNKNSEETLRRLNIGRGGNSGANAPGAVSVTEKISTQLCLDVEKFLDEMKAQGIDVEEVPSVKLLTECVKKKDTGSEVEEEAAS